MEYLFGRGGFQAFMFIGGVIVALVKLATPENNVYVVWSIVGLATMALVIFGVHLRWMATRKEYRAAVESAKERAPGSEWPTKYDVSVARGFMIFGMLIYMGYHLLDVFVVTGEGSEQRLFWIFWIRVGVSAFIGLFWVLSFTEGFRKHYVAVVTFAVTIAGVGVGWMLYFAGEQVQFYYEGFIQIIAFAAFAFRLPWRQVTFISMLMLMLYTSVTAVLHWETGWFNLENNQQAEIANNLVSLLVFTMLAVIASAALHPKQKAAA